ncbi:uncharacterized protein B0I36DRAFT_337911 [Microdochium trichocladiopsis]|uniref:Uncharacterized protein n=1 Tax=Microdochium trichocladiopsis TaxID=1682393 RepID=A0A9P8XTZ3_9PEZI|nr:uncharacterized protein B0I36DRAFT_337911 [Microdochium trichocladiopsis]KAH7016503.1 hypothetical protein B0I36DRAFT_337911 [Microdochium trichocladiopsis]
MPRKQRIILTSVFGTSHDQWRNLPTLAACYADPIASITHTRPHSAAMFLLPWSETCQDHESRAWIICPALETLPLVFCACTTTASVL